MTQISKGLLAKEYVENLVEVLLKLASEENRSCYLMREIKQDLRTDNVNTVIATIGSNPKALEIGNKCASPIKLKWIYDNQLLVTGLIVDKRGKRREGTTLTALLGIIQKNNPELITRTEAIINAKAQSEQQIRIFIINQIRNAIKYLEELVLLEDTREQPKNTSYWKFKLINLKDKNATLEENLNKVREKLGLPPRNKTTPPEAQIPNLQAPYMSNPLAQQMRDWFETLGYKFENYEVCQNSYFEWIINIPIRRNRYDRILVRGMTGEVGLKDVRALSSKVKEQHTDEGWLVTDRRISKAARSEIEKEENHRLECFTFDELVANDADFSGYLDWLEAEVKRRGIDKRYVDLACIKEELDPISKRSIGVSRYTEEDGWIDGYIKRWLDDPAKEHISILGEFGTGKTWFALHYAWVALQEYRKAQSEGVKLPRLPLVIPLRDYAKAVSVESLFSEFFFRQHEIPIPGYSAFEQLNRMGKLLLIFDGFDEMASRINRQEMINNFWELAKVVVPGAKVILTCRTEHFPEAKEEHALLNSELKASVAHLTGETPQFEILELEKFNDEQIRQILSHQAQDVTVEKVMGNPQLLDLARRPVMSELILEALPDIEAGKQLDISRVYLYAVKRKMQRDIKAERTFTSLADKLYFLCELSWEMLSTEKMSLNYRQFPDRIRRLFGGVVHQENLEHWHYDMMGQTMLIRHADGDYTPAHRSLLEFFVAYKFAAELGILADDFTQLLEAQSCLDVDAAPVDYTWSGYFKYKFDQTGRRIAKAPLKALKSEPLENLRETFGRSPLTQAVIDLMLGMIGNTEALIEVIDSTRGRSEDEVAYLGGNGATLAVKVDKYVLEGRDFSGATIKGGDFSGASLRRVNLAKANLATSIFAKILGTVWSVAFSPDGKLFAAGDINGVVSLWDAASGREIWICKEHTNWVNSVAWSPDGKMIASSSNDKTVRLWDISSGECLRTLEGHTDMVLSVAFSSDETSLLASGSSDQTVRLWDISTGECLQILRGHTSWVNSVAWSPISAASPQGISKILASGSSDQTVRLWDISTGECLHTLQGHTNWVVSVTFSPNGKNLASGSYDGMVRLWDISSGECLHTFEGHTNWVRSVAWSPTGTTLVSASNDQTLRLWDIDSGECLQILKGHTNWVNSVAWSPISAGFPQEIGTTLISGSSDQTIRLWDSNGKCLHTFEGYTNLVRSVAWSPISAGSPQGIGTTLASGSSDHMVRLWNISTGECVHTFEGHTSWVNSVAWSPNSKILASGSSDQTVRLWDISNGKCLRILQGHTSWVLCVAFSPMSAAFPEETGGILASASYDRTVRLWDINNGECLQILRGHTNWILSVAFSPNGKIFASASGDQMIRLWDVSSGECIQILQGHTSWVFCVVFSPISVATPRGFGKILASASNDQTIRLWDISSGECLQILQGHTDWIRSIAFSPDGEILASASGDRTVRLWDISSGECLYTLEEHVNWVSSVTFSPDGKILASGSNDETIKLWDVKTGKCLKTLRYEKPYEDMNITDVKGLTKTEIATLKALGAKNLSESY